MPGVVSICFWRSGEMPPQVATTLRSAPANCEIVVHRAVAHGTAGCGHEHHEEDADHQCVGGGRGARRVALGVGHGQARRHAQSVSAPGRAGWRSRGEHRSADEHTEEQDRSGAGPRRWPGCRRAGQQHAHAEHEDDQTGPARNRLVPLRSMAAMRRAAMGLMRAARKAGMKAETTVTITPTASPGSRLRA